MTTTKVCFVIMPFGEKLNVDGKTIDFDKVYKFLIKNTVEKVLDILIVLFRA